MSEGIRARHIAVDAMGGDLGPSEVVAAVKLAVAEYPELDPITFEVIRNGLVLAQVSSYWQQTLVGVIIILAVLFVRPTGLLGGRSSERV